MTAAATPGLFVTGTDTGAGKTIVAAAICAALRAAGRHVAAFKPVVTGLDEPDERWPMDHELLAAAAGVPVASVTPYTFGPPLSPHRAAELAGALIDPAVVLAHAATAARDADVLVAEGVGGLLVPLTPGYLVRDLAVDLALPLVVAARPGLGTINHTLLTIEAARAAGLHVAGVAMGPWPEDDAEATANAAAIARFGDVGVARIDFVPGPDALAAAGAALPIGDWLRA